MDSTVNLSRMIWWGWCGVGVLGSWLMIPDIKEATWAGAFISVSLLLVWSFGFLCLTLIRFAFNEQATQNTKLDESQIHHWTEIIKEYRKLNQFYSDLQKQQNDFAAMVKGDNQDFWEGLMQQATKPSNN